VTAKPSFRQLGSRLHFGPNSGFVSFEFDISLAHTFGQLVALAGDYSHRRLHNENGASQ